MSRRAVIARGAFAALAAGAALAACGARPFRLAAIDSDRQGLAAALAHRQLPAEPRPISTAGTPRVYIAAGGPHPEIAAYDLAAQKLVWRQPAQLASRVAAGGAFVAALEGTEVVGRDQATGAVTWRAPLGGTFVGLAADRERAYAVWTEGGNGVIAAFDGTSGKRLWRIAADGALGAPAAQGGVVYVPYLSQWLQILDGATGAPLARVRGIDEQIAMLRVTSTDAFFGSKLGVFHLDEQAAAGTRAGGTYARAIVPAELPNALYGPDAYDVVQSNYSAADRSRILWSGPLASYAVHYFRYVFGFDPKGAMRWAYSHPSTELVASDDTGRALAFVSQAGDVIALDPATGAVGLDRPTGIAGPVLGATFDADGWAPATGAPAPLADVLAQIARDREARFDRVKELAVRTLAAQPGTEVVRSLLAILGDPHVAGGKLAAAITDALAARGDPASLGAFADALAVHDDFLAQTSATELPPVAKAIAGLAGKPLDPALVDRAAAALRGHLDAPSTAAPDLVLVIRALAAIGGDAAHAALVAHAQLYHADDLADDPAWAAAIVAALGTADRDFWLAIAADPRTRPALDTAVQAALNPQ